MNNSHDNDFSLHADKEIGQKSKKKNKKKKLQLQFLFSILLSFFSLQ